MSPVRPEAVVPLRLGRRERLVVFGVWTLLGLLESANAYVSSFAVRGVPKSALRALVGNMPWWWLWALLTPVVIGLARRYRFDRGPWALAAGVHVSAALALSVVHILVVGTLLYFTHEPAEYSGPLELIRALLAGYLMVDILTYGAVALGYYALDFHHRYREGELANARMAVRSAQLEAQMSEARLSALRMELNPHFLFNALNAISGLVRRRENEDAVRMIAMLGDLLRQTLVGNDAREIALARELELVRRFLEIERIRFRDRLTIAIDADGNASRALLPPLLLQPLVENALRHGLAPRTGPGRLELHAARRGADLVISVSDTGAGFPGAGRGVVEGVGLSNTRARLRYLYGERGRLLLENGAEGGAVVTVRIPYRTMDESNECVQPELQGRGVGLGVIPSAS